MAEKSGGIGRWKQRGASLSIKVECMLGAEGEAWVAGPGHSRAAENSTPVQETREGLESIAKGGQEENPRFSQAMLSLLAFRNLVKSTKLIFT